VAVVAWQAGGWRAMPPHLPPALLLVEHTIISCLAVPSFLLLVGAGNICAWHLDSCAVPAHCYLTPYALKPRHRAVALYNIA